MSGLARKRSRASAAERAERSSKPAAVQREILQREAGAGMDALVIVDDGDLPRRHAPGRPPEAPRPRSVLRNRPLRPCQMLSCGLIAQVSNAASLRERGLEVPKREAAFAGGCRKAERTAQNCQENEKRRHCVACMQWHARSHASTGEIRLRSFHVVCERGCARHLHRWNWTRTSTRCGLRSGALRRSARPSSTRLCWSRSASSHASPERPRVWVCSSPQRMRCAPVRS